MPNVGLTSPNVQVICSLQREKTVTAYFKLKHYVLFGFARYICTSQCECTEIFSSEDSGITPQHSTPLQSKMAVNVYLKSNQLLPFGFVRHNTHLEIRKKVTAYLKSKTLLPFCFTEQRTAHVTGGILFTNRDPDSQTIPADTRCWSNVGAASWTLDQH